MGLEYTLVRKWDLKYLKTKKTYCRIDLSDFDIIATPSYPESQLTGKIDTEAMQKFIRRIKIVGDSSNEQIKKYWQAKIGSKILPKN